MYVLSQPASESDKLTSPSRLAKWNKVSSPKEKGKIVKDVSQLVLSRRTRLCNFLEYRGSKIVYRRYASLFFIAGISLEDNELITLEIIHRYVEQLDKYFGRFRPPQLDDVKLTRTQAMSVSWTAYLTSKRRTSCWTNFY